MSSAMTTISLTGVSGYGYHGVLEAERENGQEFIVDVTYDVDARVAAALDDLDHTVSYADVAELVHSHITGEPVLLIETLVDQIAASVAVLPGVLRASVTVHKPQAPISVPFDDVTVTVHRDRLDVAPRGEPVRAVVALGSNLGDSRAILMDAVTQLKATTGIDVLAVSPLAVTSPVGGPEQPDFHNAVAVVSTTLAARDLLRACQGIEERHGRERIQRWGPRTLDVDVITYGEMIAETTDLTVPHPRAHQRAFVLAPWAAIEPDAVLAGPGGGVVAELAAAAGDVAGVRWVSDEWWQTGGQP